jgi:hypothetical protein
MEAECMSRAKRASQMDVDEFQGFAEKVIGEYAESGRNVVPLVQALKNFHDKRNE